MRLHILVLLLAAGCQQGGPSAKASVPPSAPSVAAPTAAPKPPADVWTAAQEACVDRAFVAHGLDTFGAPVGTNYAGGTPLFNETTGHQTTRQSYLAEHVPDILRACGVNP